METNSNNSVIAKLILSRWLLAPAALLRGGAGSAPAPLAGTDPAAEMPPLKPHSFKNPVPCDFCFVLSLLSGHRQLQLCPAVPGRSGLLAGHSRQQSSRCRPLGRVVCFPDPARRDLRLWWFLGSLQSGQLLSNHLEEGFPQTV